MGEVFNKLIEQASKINNTKSFAKNKPIVVPKKKSGSCQSRRA